MEISTVGLDLGKRIFQVHGVDAAGGVMVRRKLQRAEMREFFAALPPCMVGMEACATAHHWARQIRALGHEARLIPPAYIKPYVRRSKTDAADAAAICEAVGRPNMRFVPEKSEEQQAALLHHRVRDLFVRQRTMLINALRGHLAEFGIIAPAGHHRVGEGFAARRRSMMRIMAMRTKAHAMRQCRSKSRARRRLRLIHPMLRSTIHLFGSTTKRWRSLRRTISIFHVPVRAAQAAIFGP